MEWDIALSLVASLLGTIGSIMLIYNQVHSNLHRGFYFLIMAIALVDLLSSVAWMVYMLIQLITDGLEWLFVANRLTLAMFLFSVLLGLLLALFMAGLIFHKLALSQIPWRMGVLLSAILTVAFMVFQESLFGRTNLVRRLYMKKLIEFIVLEVIFGLTVLCYLISTITLMNQKRLQRQKHRHADSRLNLETKKKADRMMLRMLLNLTLVNVLYWIVFVLADIYVLTHFVQSLNPFSRDFVMPGGLLVYANMFLMPTKGLAHHFAIQWALKDAKPIKKENVHVDSSDIYPHLSDMNLDLDDRSISRSMRFGQSKLSPEEPQMPSLEYSLGRPNSQIPFTGTDYMMDSLTPVESPYSSSPGSSDTLPRPSVTFDSFHSPKVDSSNGYFSDIQFDSLGRTDSVEQIDSDPLHLSLGRTSLVHEKE
jgi:hypothetical protein